MVFVHIKGVQACHFGNLDFEIWVEGVGQDTSQPFEGGFGSMRAMLPMWGREASEQKIKIWNKDDEAFKKSNEKWPSYAH